jgi:hypothetical protein
MQAAAGKPCPANGLVCADSGSGKSNLKKFAKCGPDGTALAIKRQTVFGL